MLRSNWNENGSVGCNESGYIFSQEKGRAIYVAKEQTDPESLNVSLHVLWQAAKPSRAVDCRPWGLHLQRMCWPLPADHSGGPRGPATGVQSPEQVRQRLWCVSQVTRGWVTSTGTHCATRGKMGAAGEVVNGDPLMVVEVGLVIGGGGLHRIGPVQAIVIGTGDGDLLAGKLREGIGQA